MAGIGFGTNYDVKAGNGLGGKTMILTVGVGGGAISQAQMDGIVQGITTGASLVTADTSPDAFTVAGIGAFTAGASTSVVVAVQGTGTPSVVTGDYFAAATVAITATFA
tara:strand:- start:1765 stop:2091 length:327 start_codon:yes stop_codon:yes gene_type:complete